MRAPECLQFCTGCPTVPTGVIAEVQSVTYTDMAEYRRLQITEDLPGFVENYVDTSMTIVSTAIELTNSSVNAGDEAVFRVERDGQTEAEVIKNIRNCNGPKRNALAKMLGSKGICQAVTPK